MKTCTKCGETKELAEFSRKKGSRDGRRSHCKECVKRYREENKEQILEYTRNYYQDNKERILERSREWREENKERIREYREENKERIREYYQDNKERFLERSREWKGVNRDKTRTYSARRRVRKTGNLSEVDLALSSGWRIVISKMPCYYCGTTDPSTKYHVDHRIPVSRGGDDSWVNLVRACESCNLSKSAKTDAEFFKW